MSRFVFPLFVIFLCVFLFGAIMATPTTGAEVEVTPEGTAEISKTWNNTDWQVEVNTIAVTNSAEVTRALSISMAESEYVRFMVVFDPFQKTLDIMAISQKGNPWQEYRDESPSCPENGDEPDMVNWIVIEISRFALDGALYLLESNWGGCIEETSLAYSLNLVLMMIDDITANGPEDYLYLLTKNENAAQLLEENVPNDQSVILSLHEGTNHYGVEYANLAVEFIQPEDGECHIYVNFVVDGDFIDQETLPCGTDLAVLVEQLRDQSIFKD